MDPVQLRMARAALKLGVRELAEIAGVATATIMRFEKEHGGLNSATVKKLKGALEEAGLEFIPTNGGGPGVRLREPA
ncbi:transcriptional regulator [Rhizobiales bacterium RZME27]|jgi:predicted transcriptional regulator|uniref:Transcriptional regulator n=1 Tax=Endobacterium cereale TaxID=2663029 RepID=A0A6A8A6Q7_9HYPH|nr:helix-turn-helix transcriptional regulator [Endobacterium cereale]MQY44531.1 transcriptional regulator [Endobacterium cereale]